MSSTPSSAGALQGAIPSIAFTKFSISARKKSPSPMFARITVSASISLHSVWRTNGESVRPAFVPSSSTFPVSFSMFRLKLASAVTRSPLSKRIIAVTKSSTSNLYSFFFTSEVLSQGRTTDFRFFLAPSLLKVAPNTVTGFGFPQR